MAMPDDYLHGHPEPVLRSHRWRTAENSSGHLLEHLRPTDVLLDVGCGPGTITVDLASRVAIAIGVDASADVVAAADRAGPGAGSGPAVSFGAADVAGLPFADGTFDVVHIQDGNEVAQSHSGCFAPVVRPRHTRARRSPGLNLGWLRGPGIRAAPSTVNCQAYSRVSLCGCLILAPRRAVLQMRLT